SSAPAGRCAWTHAPGSTSSGRSKLGVAVAGHNMIVDHPHGLHERVTDRRPHKAKAPLDQRFAHRRGFFRLGRHSAKRLPGVDLRLPADKLPEKLIERLARVLHL